MRMRGEPGRRVGSFGLNGTPKERGANKKVHGMGGERLRRSLQTANGFRREVLIFSSLCLWIILKGDRQETSDHGADWVPRSHGEPK